MALLWQVMVSHPWLFMGLLPLELLGLLLCNYMKGAMFEDREGISAKPTLLQLQKTLVTGVEDPLEVLEPPGQPEEPPLSEGDSSEEDEELSTLKRARRRGSSNRLVDSLQTVQDVIVLKRDIVSNKWDAELKRLEEEVQKEVDEMQKSVQQGNNKFLKWREIVDPKEIERLGHEREKRQFRCPELATGLAKLAKREAKSSLGRRIMLTPSQFKEMTEHADAAKLTHDSFVQTRSSSASKTPIDQDVELMYFRPMGFKMGRSKPKDDKGALYIFDPMKNLLALKQGVLGDVLDRLRSFRRMLEWHDRYFTAAMCAVLGLLSVALFGLGYLLFRLIRWDWVFRGVGVIVFGPHWFVVGKCVVDRQRDEERKLSLEFEAPSTTEARKTQMLREQRERMRAKMLADFGKDEQEWLQSIKESYTASLITSSFPSLTVEPNPTVGHLKFTCLPDPKSSTAAPVVDTDAKQRQSDPPRRGRKHMVAGTGGMTAAPVPKSDFLATASEPLLHSAAAMSKSVPKGFDAMLHAGSKAAEGKDVPDELV